MLQRGLSIHQLTPQLAVGLHVVDYRTRIASLRREYGGLAGFPYNICEGEPDDSSSPTVFINPTKSKDKADGFSSHVRLCADSNVCTLPPAVEIVEIVALYPISAYMLQMQTSA